MRKVIAVFGLPGMGKTRGVRQVARESGRAGHSRERGRRYPLVAKLVTYALELGLPLVVAVTAW